MKLLVLGAPGLIRDHWQDDLVDEARRIGWHTEFTRLAGQTVSDVTAQARGFDIVLWTYTHNHLPSGDAVRMLREIEAGGSVTVGLHLDLYWGLPAREQRIGKYAWWTCQYVYTSDGGERDWVGRGVNHRWCPPAVGLRHVGRAEPRGRYRCIFTGAYTHSIHTDHRARMISWARRTWRRDFHWYGTSPHSRIYGEQLSGAVAYARCVLGDSAPAPYYWSDRVVRTAARGGVLAHPQVDGMKELGFDETTMIPFDRYDFDSIVRKLNDTSDAECIDLRESAVELIRSRHTWSHRLTQIAEDVGLA